MATNQKVAVQLRRMFLKAVEVLHETEEVLLLKKLLQQEIHPDHHVTVEVHREKNHLQETKQVRAEGVLREEVHANKITGKEKHIPLPGRVFLFYFSGGM